MLNGNLVIKMPDYETNEPFYSFIGNKKVITTFKTLLKDFDELRLVPEVVVKKISKHAEFNVEEDRDQYDYVYLLKDQVVLSGKSLKNRRNKGRKFYQIFEKNLSVQKINFNNPEYFKKVMAVYNDWVRSKKNLSSESIKHEKVAIKRLFDASKSFNLMGLLVSIDDKPVGFSLCEAVNKDYAICRFHKSVLNYKHLDAFFSNLVAIELKHLGSKYLSWEQDLGVEGLREFKSSYKPIKFLKKYTITKSSV